MFRVFYMFLGKWFDALIRFLQVSQGFVSYLISTGFGIVLALMISLTTCLQWMSGIIGWLISLLDKTVMPAGITQGLTSTVTIMSIMEIANTFFPVVEGFIGMVVMAVLAGSLMMYGLVKSWIPTVSG